jgi:prophage antirepressor-like protein
MDDLITTDTPAPAFAFGGVAIRVVSINGEPWFVGKDIAEVLGYSNSARSLNDHCKALKKFDYTSLVELGVTNPPSTGLILIPERDVYRLIMRSEKPEAERFEEMIVSEILPAIRKTGAYQAVPLTELERVKLLVEMTQKYYETLQIAEAQKAKMDAVYMVPRLRLEASQEGIAIRSVKTRIAPFLSEKVIELVLKWYEQPKTLVQYGSAEGAVVRPFARNGVEEIVDRFISEAVKRVSFSRKCVVLEHDCLLGNEARITKEDAIEYLGYTDSDFED